MVYGKYWYLSKTLWVNGLTILAALLTFLIAAFNNGELPFPLDPKWALFVLGVVNFVLRWVTDTKLKV